MLFGCQLHVVRIQLHRHAVGSLSILVIRIIPDLRHRDADVLVVHPREGDSSQVGVGIGRYRGSHFGSRAARRRGHPLTPCVSDCDDRLVKDIRAGDRLLTEIIGLTLIDPVEVGQSITPCLRRVVSRQGRLPGFVDEYNGRRCAIDVAVQHELGVRDLLASYADLFDCQLCRQDVVILEVICLIFRMILHRPLVGVDKFIGIFVNGDFEREQKRSRVVSPRLCTTRRPGFGYFIHEVPRSAAGVRTRYILASEPECTHFKQHFLAILRVRRESDAEVLVGDLLPTHDLEGHRCATRRHNMEREGPFHTGLREIRRDAVAVELELLGDLDRALRGHDLNQQHQTAKAVVAAYHPLSDTDDLARILNAAKGAHAEGAAIAITSQAIRRGLIMVRAGDIFSIPSRNRDVAAFAELQIIVLSGAPFLRGHQLKVVSVIFMAIGCRDILAALAIEPGLAVASGGDRLFQHDHSSPIWKIRTVLRDHDLVHSTHDRRNGLRGIGSDAEDGEAHVGEVGADRGIALGRIHFDNHGVRALALRTDETGRVKRQHAPRIGRIVADDRVARPRVVRLAVGVEYDRRVSPVRGVQLYIENRMRFI